MDTQSLSSKDITTLINHLLKSQDPAAVGLKRILKKKTDKDEDFPVQALSLDEFAGAGTRNRSLSEDDQRILELERKVRQLQEEIVLQKKRAEQAIRNAHNQGVVEGHAQGQTDGRQAAAREYDTKVGELQNRLASMMEQWAGSQKDLVLGAQHTLIRFACELAKKIIRTELSSNPDVVLHVVKRALAYVAEREQLTVRVCPEDWETVSSRQNFWKPVQDRLSDVSIVAEEHVGRGGCIIESSSGAVDARIQVQLEELLELIDKTWEGICSAAEQPEHVPEPPSSAQASSPKTP